VAGVDDEAHQYFGEEYLATSVRLAPGAVVLLHHLCYASGAAEPGMAQPALDVAVARVDNFGAGFIAAGAAAVVAEAHGGPAYYVDALFRGRGTVEDIWRANPAFHDHVLAFDSVRTAGARVLLDPDRRTTGFYRSLVSTPGHTAADVLAGTPANVPTNVPGSGVPDPGRPSGVSLLALGASPATLRLAGPVVVDSATGLILSFDQKTAALLPDALTIGTRWDLLVPEAGPGPTGAAEPAPPAEPASSITPSSSGEPVSSPAPVPPTQPASSVEPAPSAGPSPAADPEPPAIDLVKPEVTGSLVTMSPTTGISRRLAVTVTPPAAPGLYRLVTTLHDADGIAYDAASQELVTPLLVRVTGRLWASYGIPEQVATTAGASFALRVRLANSGSVPWGVRPVEDLVNVEPIETAIPPRLVARWVALDGMPAGGPDGSPAGASYLTGAN